MDDNIKNLRDALEWLYIRIREEAELDGEMTNDHAIQLGFITNMLEKFPLRQCDVGTPEDQCKRWRKFCDTKRCCEICACSKGNGISADCFAKWAQMPYEAQEGGECNDNA